MQFTDDGLTCSDYSGNCTSTDACYIKDGTRGSFAYIDAESRTSYICKRVKETPVERPMRLVMQHNSPPT